MRIADALKCRIDPEELASTGTPALIISAASRLGPRERMDFLHLTMQRQGLPGGIEDLLDDVPHDVALYGIDTICADRRIAGVDRARVMDALTEKLSLQSRIDIVSDTRFSLQVRRGVYGIHEVLYFIRGGALFQQLLSCRSWAREVAEQSDLSRMFQAGDAGVLSCYIHEMYPKMDITGCGIQGHTRDKKAVAHMRQCHGENLDVGLEPIRDPLDLPLVSKRTRERSALKGNGVADICRMQDSDKPMFGTCRDYSPSDLVKLDKIVREAGVQKVEVGVVWCDPPSAALSSVRPSVYTGHPERWISWAENGNGGAGLDLVLDWQTLLQQLPDLLEFVKARSGQIGISTRGRCYVSALREDQLRLLDEVLLHAEDGSMRRCLRTLRVTSNRDREVVRSMSQAFQIWFYKVTPSARGEALLPLTAEGLEMILREGLEADFVPDIARFLEEEPEQVALFTRYEMSASPTYLVSALVGSYPAVAHAILESTAIPIGAYAARVTGCALQVAEWMGEQGIRTSAQWSMAASLAENCRDISAREIVDVVLAS